MRTDRDASPPSWKKPKVVSPAHRGRAGEARDLAGGADLLGSHDAQGDEDGNEEKFLHATTLPPRSPGRKSRGGAAGASVGDGGVRAPGGPHRLQSGWDG